MSNNTTETELIQINRRFPIFQRNGLPLRLFANALPKKKSEDNTNRSMIPACQLIFILILLSEMLNGLHRQMSLSKDNAYASNTVQKCMEKPRKAKILCPCIDKTETETKCSLQRLHISPGLCAPGVREAVKSRGLALVTCSEAQRR